MVVSPELILKVYAPHELVVERYTQWTLNCHPTSILQTEVTSVGLASAIFTTLIVILPGSFHIGEMCWRWNFLASSLIFDGYSFRLVRMVPHAYVPCERSLEKSNYQSRVSTSDGLCESTTFSPSPISRSPVAPV